MWILYCMTIIIIIFYVKGNRQDELCCHVSRVEDGSVAMRNGKLHFKQSVRILLYVFVCQ